jgi:protein-disulfide isomerase
VAQNSGAPTLVGALILGAAIVAGAFMIQGSIEDATVEISALRESIGSAQQAAAPSRNAPTRAARPDPNRRYSVNTAGSPVKGNPEAKIAIVEFSDFQCPFCGRVGPTLEKITKEYADDVRIVFKHLPLRIHPKAPAAHAAAEAAHRQGKFWEMHDRIFGNQRALEDSDFVGYATELGLDVEKFNADRKSAEVSKRVAADSSEASKLGVTGTPAFFVNGRFVSGAQPFETFQKLIDEELGRG